MTTTLRALDLFAGGGGCSVGYVRAGWDVEAWDLLPMPAYPFLEIGLADALAVLADVDYCRTFDLIHASPPCKPYTSLRALSHRKHPKLIEPVRAALQRIGRPYIIENVPGAPLIEPVVLCGSMFDLGLGAAILKRHRLFESSLPLTAPPDRCHGRAVVGVYGNGGSWTRTAAGGGGTKVNGADAAAAMGVDWTTRQDALSQMVPPSYTEHLGLQAAAILRAAA